MQLFNGRHNHGLVLLPNRLPPGDETNVCAVKREESVFRAQYTCTGGFRAGVTGCTDGKSQGESIRGGEGAGYIPATNMSERRGYGKVLSTVPGEALNLVPFWDKPLNL